MRLLIIGSSGFIGKHLVPYLEKKGHALFLCDLGIEESENSLSMDLMNPSSLAIVIGKFNPDVILNLAAITDNKGKNLDYYSVNFLGVSNLIQTIMEINPQVRLFHFSTQYVLAPTDSNRGIEKPVNTYGESKLIAEGIIKATENLSWTIFRPTNVWGENHPGFTEGIWKYIENGWYIHPKAKITRSYVWIDSLCEQLTRFLMLPGNKTRGHTYYITDPAIDSFDWVNSFSELVRGKPVRRIDSRFHFSLALIGEMLETVKIPFPMNMERYRNLTINYVVDYKASHDAIDYSEIDFEMAMKRLSDWYKSHG